MSRKIKVLLSKVGLDGHERGIKVIAMGLADAGMEVIYTGMYQTPDRVVATAIQEDVDVLGVSTLSGGHMATFSEILGLLKKEGKEKDILLIGGGIVPQDDVQRLKEMGVSELFRPGTKMGDVVKFIKSRCEGGKS